MSAPAPKSIPAETAILSSSRLISQALSALESDSKSSQPPSKDALAQLSLSLKILTNLDPYLDANSTPPPKGFQDLADATVDEDWAARHKEGKTAFPLGPHFSAGPYEGMFVAQVARSVRAKRVLEIGMFTGTTTLCVATHLPADGKIVALEIDAYLKDFVMPHMEKAGVGNKVDIRTGPAKDTLKQLADQGESFDLIFIDADKSGYVGYFNTILDTKLLAPGGTMLVDNTLYSACGAAPLTPLHIC